MKKDPKIFLDHILECIQLIEEYTKEKTRDEFLKSIALQDMTIRRIEIIGEAARNLPEDLKKKYADVPWKKIVGMRDKLTHDYFGVDIDLTWGVIQKELPILKKRISEIKEEMK